MVGLAGRVTRHRARRGRFCHDIVLLVLISRPIQSQHLLTRQAVSFVDWKELQKKRLGSTIPKSRIAPLFLPSLSLSLLSCSVSLRLCSASYLKDAEQTREKQENEASQTIGKDRVSTYVVPLWVHETQKCGQQRRNNIPRLDLRCPLGSTAATHTHTHLLSRLCCSMSISPHFIFFSSSTLPTLLSLPIPLY